MSLLLTTIVSNIIIVLQLLLKRSHGNGEDDQNSNYKVRGEVVALNEGQENNKTEKIVPIWGEEIIVQKRKVKLGEIAIQKRRVIESKKIDIDIKREKVIVEYPDGRRKNGNSTNTSN